VLGQLRIGRAHLLDHGAGEVGDERGLHSDPEPVLDRATNDPAEDIAPSLVRGRDPLAGQERHPTAVVGEDPVRLGCVR
jgi:hypothetical protein